MIVANCAQCFAKTPVEFQNEEGLDDYLKVVLPQGWIGSTELQVVFCSQEHYKLFLVRIEETKKQIVEAKSYKHLERIDETPK